MKKNVFYLTALAAVSATMMTSCINDENENSVTNSGEVINLTASMATETTRAKQDATENQDEQFESGQSIFVEAYKTGTTTSYTNSTGNYTTGSSGAMEGSILYPYTDGVVSNVDVRAYYPTTNNSNNVTSSLTSFTVSTDQTDKAKYQANDLMYASATNLAKGSTHNLTFYHALTKIIVNLVADGTIDDASLTKVTAVKINSTKPTITIANGVTTDNTASGTAADIDITGSDKANYAGIIVPQTVAAGSDFITVTYNGQTLVYKIPTTPDTGKNFEKGTKYTYTLTLKASSISLKSLKIENWGTGEGDTKDMIL